MSIIALFFPAFISLNIRYKRKKMYDQKVAGFILKYGIYVLINTFVTQAIITFLLRMDGIEMSAFSSFPFFIKYVMIASVIAFLTPYVEEILEKSINVSFEIEDNSGRNEKK